MKTRLIIALLILTVTSAHAQNSERINFGIKGGFNSTLLLISDFDINGSSVEEERNYYKIGFFGSLFMRINFGRHFLQPEASYTVNKGSITFLKPVSGEDSPTVPKQEANISSTIRSIEVPLLYGYNLIKEGPYGLAIFGGPKASFLLKDRAKTTFTNLNLTNLHEELYPVNLSFTVGAAVNIHPIFFDFRYDIGLHNISRRLSYTRTSSSTEISAEEEIRFHRQDNVLSFSMGVFF